MANSPMPIFIVVALVALVPLIWYIAQFNGMVRIRNHIKESWADIDVQLKRRYDLIPNLVETVKGYANHERQVLERVVELRNKAQQNHGPQDSQAVDESALMLGLKQLFAVVEGYPQLKADNHFLALQKELALTEDRIAAARRFFNANVREMRNRCQMFPTTFIASVHGFRAPSFFELQNEAERVVPRIDL